MAAPDAAAAAFNPLSEKRRGWGWSYVHSCRLWPKTAAAIELAFNAASQFGTALYHAEIPGVVYNHNASGFIVLHPFGVEKT